MTDEHATTMATLRRVSPGGREFAVREPILEDECRWFNVAVEQGLFELRDCVDDCFRLKKWGASGQDEFTTPAGVLRHLFSSPHAERPGLNREYIPHIAAYARAICHYGYDADRASFSLYRKYSRDLITKKRGASYETDAEFYRSDGGIRLHIEAKAAPRPVERLARELDRVTSLIELPTTAIKEIEYVLDLVPEYLWLVGPGSIEPAAYVYAVTVDGRNARFDRVEDVPSPLAD